MGLRKGNRLLFVSHLDARDPRSWSGIPSRLLQGLEKEFDEVEVLPPLNSLNNLKRFAFLAKRLPCRFRPWICHHPDWSQYHPSFRFQTLQAIRQRARGAKAIFSIFPDLVAAADLPLPWAFFSDATFPCLRKAYFPDRPLHKGFLSQAHRVWRLAARSDAAFLTSGWARESAVSECGFSADRVHVKPMGASLVPLNDNRDWLQTFAQRRSVPCRLVWIGIEWDRKGGDLAIELARRLNAEGIPTRLDMVGGVPDTGTTFPEFVYHHGKRYPQDSHAFLDDLFAKASFFVLPTKAECAGIVFSEAASFGVPSLAPRIHGVPTAIAEGLSGHTFPPASFIDDCLECIRSYRCHADAYQQLCMTARQHFQSVANWDHLAQTIAARLKAF